MTEQTIPKDLQDTYHAAKSLAMTHDILLNGSFNYKDLSRVPMAMAFLKALHEQTMNNLLAHPQADLIQDVKEYKDGINKENNSDTTGDNSSSEASSTL